MVPPIKKILITAGPTREKLDPVRFVSNLSTGVMGYTLAEVAAQKGYQVTLVSGPTAMKPPKGVRFVPILSAHELKKVCEELFPKNDCLFMAAAVCDFMPINSSRHKIPSRQGFILKLKRTPDVLKSLAKRKGKRIVIGFCVETRNLIRRAKEKLLEKKLDGIVANSYHLKRNIPFGDRRTKVVFIDSRLKILRCPQQSKRQIAYRLLRWMEYFGRS